MTSTCHSDGKKKDWKGYEFRKQIKTWIEEGNVHGDVRKEMVELVTRRIGPLVLERLTRLGVPG